MQIGRLGSLIGFAIGCLGGGVQMIAPDPKFYGWLLIGVGCLTLIVSLPWWMFVNYRLRLPWIARDAPESSHSPNNIKSERRALIKDAREWTVRVCHQENTDFREAVASYEPFFTLRPFLSADYLKKLNASRTIYIETYGSKLPPLANWFLDELDRLEAKWDLR
jgi:hypothetical protein